MKIRSISIDHGFQAANIDYRISVPFDVVVEYLTYQSDRCQNFEADKVRYNGPL